MHERQAINTTSGSSSMKPKSFSLTLRSSVEDVHMVTLPANISAADQTNTNKLDVWSRFNGVPEFEELNQLEPRLVESRLSIIDRQDRIIKAQLDKINHDRKSMKADVRKYEDLVEYLGKCEYGDDKNVVNKSDTISDVEFLLDEKAAQKLDLDEILEKVNALKSQVEYRMKKLAQGITQLKTEYDKHGLQGEDDEAKVCLRNLLMKIGPFGTRVGGTKIPMLVSADKSKGSEDNFREFRSSKTMSRKTGKDGIKQMSKQTESGNKRHSGHANTDEKNKYTSKRNDKNTYTQSQDINRRYKDIKSKLNTGRKCVERKVENASFEQSIASSEIAAKKKPVDDDVHQLDEFEQENKKEKRRNVTKSKIDTGRNNVVAKGQHVSEKRNGNNKLAPLPKVRGRGHDVKDLINPPGVRNGALTPLQLNNERSTPLPPIKSARRDNDNMKTGIKEDDRNAGGMRISVAPSPPPRDQPSHPHIIDSAERTQHRALY